MTSGRQLIQINQVVFDQPDFFEADDFTRKVGLAVGDLTHEVFFNNVRQPWTLIDGSPTLDSQVRTGVIYWTEISGCPGFYNVRWRPNAIGYWRVLLTYTAGTQIVGQGYDVMATLPQAETGLRSTFTKPC